MGPVIACVSLGAERLFRLKGQKGQVALAEPLCHGSLLIMAGNTQKNFKHEVPKSQTLLSHASASHSGTSSTSSQIAISGHVPLRPRPHFTSARKDLTLCKAQTGRASACGPDR